MKHYTRLNGLETQVYHLRENFALFDSVMEAHMNEFDISQTPLGLSLWRLLELMRTNTKKLKINFMICLMQFEKNLMKKNQFLKMYRHKHHGIIL